MNEYAQYLLDRERDMVIDIMFGLTVKEYLNKTGFTELFDAMSEEEYEVYERLNEWLFVMRFDELPFEERRLKLGKMFVKYLSDDFNEIRNKVLISRLSSF